MSNDITSLHPLSAMARIADGLHCSMNDALALATAATNADALRAERDALQVKLDAIEDRTAHKGDGGWPWSWHDETLKPDDPMIAYWLGADRMLCFIRTGSPHPEGDTHD